MGLAWRHCRPAAIGGSHRPNIIAVEFMAIDTGRRNLIGCCLAQMTAATPFDLRHQNIGTAAGLCRRMAIAAGAIGVFGVSELSLGHEVLLQKHWMNGPSARIRSSRLVDLVASPADADATEITHGLDGALVDPGLGFEPVFRA